MVGISRLWVDNPVLVKELRTRMRGSRAYWILAGYILFLAFILFVQYTVWFERTRSTGHGLASGSKIGQEFFTWITVTQAFLVAFITPAITSGAITIEKEQRTLDMLQMSRILPGQIVFGKLFAAVGFVLILLVSSIPIASICFFLGGVSPEQILKTYVILGGSGFLAGAVGLAWSSIAKSTTVAVILTYLTFGLPIVLTIIFTIFYTAALADSSSGLLMALHIGGIYGAEMPWMGWSPMQPFLQYWNFSRAYSLSYPSWIVPLLTYGMLGLLLTSVTSNRLRSFPDRKSGFVRLVVVFMCLQQMFFYFGGAFCAYVASAPGAAVGVLNGVSLHMLLLYPVFMILVCVPAFTVRSVDPMEGVFRPKRDPFLNLAGCKNLLIMTLSVLGLYWFSFVITGHAGDAGAGIIGGNTQLIVPAMRMNGTGANMVAPLVPNSALLSLSVMLMVSIMGLTAFGEMLSRVIRNRWVALVGHYVLLAIVILIPSIDMMKYMGSAPYAYPGIFINLCYLNPMTAIAQYSSHIGNFWSEMPLLFGHTPVWLVTTVTYLVLTPMCLFVSWRLHQRQMPLVDIQNEEVDVSVGSAA